MAHRFIDADRGRIARRQLLKALGLITADLVFAAPAMKAAAEFGATLAQVSNGDGKAFPVTTVNHLALSSNNYARSRDFYVDLFGMRVAWDDGRGCALEFGSLTSPNGIYIRPAASRGAKPTIGHIAFGIPNFLSQKAGMKAEIERRGLKGVRPDGEMGWSCYDPAGFMLDIWVPEKDKAMFPGAAGPCKVAASPSCVAAWQAGQKNLSASAKASGKGFKATSYSFIVLNVPDVSKERDFYRDLLGMKVIYDNSEARKGECFLRFGQNTLQLRQTADPYAKPSCNQFGLIIENFKQDTVEAELSRRGLEPKPDSKLSWTIVDPDGYQIDVSAPGFSEHIANDCLGSKATCPGGPTG
jgi:catechol 2,3-dioxygenase-like lactoylglutathione lyase family enzyme